jgi:hypothetical protein
MVHLTCSDFYVKSGRVYRAGFRSGTIINKLSYLILSYLIPDPDQQHCRKGEGTKNKCVQISIQYICCFGAQSGKSLQKFIYIAISVKPVVSVSETGTSTTLDAIRYFRCVV